MKTMMIGAVAVAVLAFANGPASAEPYAFAPGVSWAGDSGGNTYFSIYWTLDSGYICSFGDGEFFEGQAGGPTISYNGAAGGNLYGCQTNVYASSSPRTLTKHFNFYVNGTYQSDGDSSNNLDVTACFNTGGTGCLIEASWQPAR